MCAARTLARPKNRLTASSPGNGSDRCTQTTSQYFVIATLRNILIAANKTFPTKETYV